MLLGRRITKTQRRVEETPKHITCNKTTKADCDEKESGKRIAVKKKHETILQGRRFTKTHCEPEETPKIDCMEEETETCCREQDA